MRLVPLLTTYPPTSKFSSFLRRKKHGNTMPPLNVPSLCMDISKGNEMAGRFDGLSTNVPYDLLDAMLTVRYRGKLGAVLGLQEITDGADWLINRAQTVHSRKGYRVGVGLHWAQCFMDTLKTLGELPDAEAQRICLPDLHVMTHGSVDDPHVIERLQSCHAAIQMCLKMRWSDEDGLFVADTKKF